jgi:hypothetical protein
MEVSVRERKENRAFSDRKRGEQIVVEGRKVNAAFRSF